MRPSLLAAFGLILATAACGNGMDGKPTAGGPVGIGGDTAAGTGGSTASERIGERRQSGTGSTYSAPASRSTVPR